MTVGPLTPPLRLLEVRDVPGVPQHGEQHVSRHHARHLRVREPRDGNALGKILPLDQ
ncbi:hypothetical protein D3C87_1479200 [compost metagenome]